MSKPRHRYHSRRAQRLTFRANVALACTFPFVLFILTAFVSAGRWLPALTLLIIPVLALSLAALASYALAAWLESTETTVKSSDRQAAAPDLTHPDLRQGAHNPVSASA